MRPTTFLLAFFLPFACYCQKTKDHTAVAAEIAANIQSANFGSPSVRLAVVTFVPLQQSSQDLHTFGEYLTESIIGKLTPHSEKFKLFERKRVDAILKENEFMLSGMIKASEAIRIGEMLPIDALFSGTYTKLKSYVDVTGRLIDVTSGEILMSYTGRIRLTKNIKTLFPDAPSSDTPDAREPTQQKKTESVTFENKEARCKSLTETFQAKLHDLTTTQKVDALVREAMATPFENTCGKLHYHFINALSRYDLHPAEYEKFLLSTLDTIAYPAGDDRAYSILSYLTKDKNASDPEWRTGLNTIRKVGDYTLSSYLGFLFNRIVRPDSLVLQKRSDEFFNLLAAGEIGLPRPLPFDRGFYEMMEALSVNHELRRYVYGKYGHRLSTEPDNVTSLHFMYLKRMYSDAVTRDQKASVISWIADYFNRHVNKKSGDQLYDLAREFVPYPDDENSKFKIDRNKEAALTYPAEDLAVLVDKCRDRFASYAVETPYASQREDRINFCVRAGISIPGVIPSISEARSILTGQDLHEQRRIMKLLLLMGTQVAPLEKELVSLLDRRSIDNREALTEIQEMALHMLGTLRTKEQKAINHMVRMLKNYDKAAEISTEALVSIGKPAVSVLVNQLRTTTIHEGGLQYRIVAILGRIGPDAKAASPTLRSLLEKTTNKDIRYAIEAALQAFGE